MFTHADPAEAACPNAAQPFTKAQNTDSIRPGIAKHAVSGSTVTKNS